MVRRPGLLALAFVGTVSLFFVVDFFRLKFRRSLMTQKPGMNPTPKAAIKDPDPELPRVVETLLHALTWGFPKNWAAELNSGNHSRPFRIPNLVRDFPRNWSAVDEIVELAGHLPCATLRDLYGCAGAEYLRVLKETPLWNSSYDIMQLPRGTRIFAVGNSVLAELLEAALCYHNWDFVFPDPNRTTNSFIAHNVINNITMLLVSNDPTIDGAADLWSPVRLARLVQPQIIVLGTLNERPHWWGGDIPRMNQRRHLLVQEFPDAAVVDLAGKHVGDCCPADLHNCKRPSKCESKTYEHHECIPGPILRYAEQFVAVLHKAVRKEDMSRSCLGVGRIRPLRSCVVSP
ncbi:unnamed protein product [Symbiodinium sp. CCMP2592]|nr:unnamed protein product [Symbiodinium sp. CCMP2592]